MNRATLFPPEFLTAPMMYHPHSATSKGQKNIVFDRSLLVSRSQPGSFVATSPQSRMNILALPMPKMVQNDQSPMNKQTLTFRKSMSPHLQPKIQKDDTLKKNKKKAPAKVCQVPKDPKAKQSVYDSILSLATKKAENRARSLKPPGDENFHAQTQPDLSVNHNPKQRVLTQGSEPISTPKLQKVQFHESPPHQPDSEEVKKLVGLIKEKSNEIDMFKELLKKRKEQINHNVRKILEEHDSFTNKVIKALQEHTEHCMLKLNIEVSEEISGIDNLTKKIGEFETGLKNIKNEIQNFFAEPCSAWDKKFFDLSLNKYYGKINAFKEMSDLINEKYIINKKVFSPSRKSGHFQEKLKERLEDIFKRLETTVGDDKKKKICPNSIRFHGTKSVEHFEGTAETDKTETLKKRLTLLETQRSPSHNLNQAAKNILISFENRDLFKNALQSDPRMSKGVNTTQDTHRKTLTSNSNFFKTDSGEGSVSLFSDLKRTPRLTFELEDSVNTKINEFRPEDEKQDLHMRSPTGFNSVLKEINLNKLKK